MKNKILALLATIGLVSSASAIEINDNLSINGFIDGSYSSLNNDADVDLNGDGAADGDNDKIGIDEVELNFLLNVGNVSGEVHIDNTNAGSSDDLNIEQAHFTYTFDNGISATFGRYGSDLGLEGEDPAGLYTFSRAYENALNYGDVDNVSVEGLRLAYAADVFSLSVSLDQSEGNNLETAGEGLNYEIALGYTGIENLQLNIGYRAQNDGLTTAADAPLTVGQSKDTDHFNINGIYTFGKGAIGAEWQQMSTDLTDVGSKGNVDAYQILIDYDFTNQFGAAVRYSVEDRDVDESSSNETSKWTIAPNYAITESLGAILEYSSISRDAAAPNAEDSSQWALELTYTF